MRVTSLRRRLALTGVLAFGTLLGFPHQAVAQETGSVSGTVTRADDGSALSSVTITVEGTGIVAVSNTKGQYTIPRVPVGAQTLVFRWLGYTPRSVSVTIAAGAAATADVALEASPIQLSEIVVSGVSRAPERVTTAPSAVSSIDPRVMQATSISGQVPMVLRDVPGVDMGQSGVNDFNVNARGFNSSLNRRVLVLQDGRDVSIAFLQSQEWTALPMPTEDFSKVEFISGPGSALYGANAYNGVLDISTPTAREVVGTKLSVGGGSLGTVRGDLRHAGVLSQGRLGYRLNLGYSTSDTWSRSRTWNDGSSLRREYQCSLFTPDCQDATDSLPPLGRELLPLKGQTKNATTGEPEGDRDPITSTYGSARLDYYLDDGSVLTAEAGMASVQNETFVTGIGRIQVTGADRPYARFGWSSESFNLMAYWNGRDTRDPQVSLASTAQLTEKSNVFHIEGQGNASFEDGRGQFVYGASVRNTNVNTSGTLMLADDDDRSDYSYAGFAQASYDLSDIVKLVLAGRVDFNSLIDPQFSPKAALVVTPNANHSFRFTFNKAFQTPNYSEYFLRAAAGAPANFLALEAGMRASALGPALAGVPQGQLYTNSAAVPVWARGNGKLDVEKTTGYEIGYAGDISSRVWVTVDAFYNNLSNFVTDLLPGVNSAFPFWTAPKEVPSAFRGALEQATRNALLATTATRTAGLGLTRTEDGNTGIVVSYANAGTANMWGSNLGAGFQLTDEIRADGYLSWFDYSIDEDQVATGDKLLANTPEWRHRLALSYNGRQGFDARLGYRSSTGFQWAAGTSAGWVEPAMIWDADAGYRINNNLRVYVSGQNIFDKQWFSIYAGSVNGARILGGLTANF